MGDDGKVTRESTDLVAQTKLEFLREVIQDFKRRQSRYDLGHEFAKTKKNRSPLVPIMIVGMIVLFAAGAIGVTAYINQTQGNIQVDIGDFEDVNLRELLDQAQQLEQEMQAAQRRLNALTTERDNRIESIQESAERDIELLGARNLSQAEVNRQAEQIRNQAEQQVAEVREEYSDQITEAEAQIEDIQDRMAQYDSRQLEQAREQERILNNQTRLHEIELENQAEEYEEQIQELTENYESRIAELETFAQNLEANLRQSHAEEIARLEQEHAREIADLIALYNPTFTSDEIVALINAPSDLQAIEGAQLVAFDSALAAEGVISREGYESLANRLSEYMTLVERLRQIPYENSIPPTISQLEYRVVELIRRYEDLWAGLLNTVEGRDQIIAQRESTIAQRESRIADLEAEVQAQIRAREQAVADQIEAREETVAELETVISQRQAEIDRFLYALEELTNQNRENGYILDPRNTDNIVVYLDTLRQVVDGTIGYVFRRDDEFIGTIRFDSDGNRVSASLVELAGDFELAPYDKVLVEVQ